jgi:hypothetical protein
MRVHSAPVRAITIAALFAATAILAAPAWAQNGPSSRPKPAEKTAGQAFKNIKVLNNVPADKLFDGMRYITMALGVRCEFCHKEHNFASDQKRTKRTARKMMRMLFAIDKDNFHGRTEVSCYTCHDGHHHPVAAPMPAEAAETAPAPGTVMPRAKPIQPAAGTPIPTLDQILASYAKALGGRQALANVKSRVLEVERSGERAGRPPITQKIYEGAPDKLLILTRFRGRTFRTGDNGAEVWQSSPRGARVLRGMEALLPPHEAELNPLAAIEAYKGKRLVAMAQIGDRKAYVVTGRAPDGIHERLFFDAKSGLLLRRSIVYRTIFGPLLFEADYSHYRKHNGVAIPYKTLWWGGGMGWTETVKSVKTNVPVKDAEFQPPARGARPAPAGRR